MQKVNKFNSAWQLVRVKAKKTKDADKKIELVITYYKNNFTKSDLNRVLNWLKTTRMGYKASPQTQQKFDVAIKALDMNPTVFDNKSTIQELSKQEAKDILKDLKTRKYDFQFKGKAPLTHKQFVNELEVYIGS